MLFFSPASAPFNPTILAPANSFAAPVRLTAVLMASHAPVPAISTVLAARTASLPKIVARAAFRCSCVSPPSAVLNCDTISLMGSIAPCESYTLMPSDFIRFAALSVGACRLSIICLRLVPASLPRMPALAISPMAVTMSSTGTFALANTDDAICMASPTSLTSAALALAAAASRSATRLASDPASPNELSAAAATCAA